MVTVKLFGSLRLDSGIKELSIDADSMKALYPLLASELERLSPGSGITAAVLKGCVAAVNGKQTRRGQRLSDGDTVVFLSPAAGG